MHAFVRFLSILTRSDGHFNTMHSMQQVQKIISLTDHCKFASKCLVKTTQLNAAEMILQDVIRTAIWGLYWIIFSHDAIVMHREEQLWLNFNDTSHMCNWTTQQNSSPKNAYMHYPVLICDYMERLMDRSTRKWRQFISMQNELWRTILGNMPRVLLLTFMSLIINAKGYGFGLILLTWFVTGRLLSKLSSNRYHFSCQTQWQESHYRYGKYGLAAVRQVMFPDLPMKLLLNTLSYLISPPSVRTEWRSR